MPRPGRLDYGWAVVAGLCVTETVSWGIIYYGFPGMLRQMEAELGFSRAEITRAFSAGLAVAPLARLPVRRRVACSGARPTRRDRATARSPTTTVPASR